MTPAHWSLFLLSVPSFVSSKTDYTAYAPTVGVACPSNVSLLRQFPPSNQSISPREAEYIAARESLVSQSWRTLIGDGSQLGYNASIFSTLPRAGIALSGGGERAALYGAGVLEALDGRNASSVAAGTGGLLQITSYLTGLSGGSWTTSSVIFNDFPLIRSLVSGDSQRPGWMLDLNLAVPGGQNIFSDDNEVFFGSILAGVRAKEQVGMDTSITDIWARILSYRFLTQNETTRENFFTNDTGHGAGTLWSQIPQLESFQNHSVPFPIIIACSRASLSKSDERPGLETTVYEINPFEMGSFDPSLSAMTDIKFAGTHLLNGNPDNSSACTTGFDQAAFMIAASANVFNLVFDFAREKIKGFDGSASDGLLTLLERDLREAKTRKDDVANWPNPFKGISSATFQDANSSWLDLVDGSESFENIPLTPLFAKARNVDVIFAVDASADDDRLFVNGTSTLATMTRLRFTLPQTHLQFPPAPESIDDYLSTGVTLRPTFFGCEPSQTPPEYPLVIFLPRTPPVNGDDPVTNLPTFRLSYTQKHVTAFLNQVFYTTTSGFIPGSKGPDPNYGRCLQCAAIDRARLKASPIIPRSDFCSTCFTRYCYDPAKPPSVNDLVGLKFAFKDPDPSLGEYFSRNKAAIIAGVSITIALIIALTIFFCLRSTRKARALRMLRQAADNSYPLKHHDKNRSEASEPLLDAGHEQSGNDFSQLHPTVSRDNDVSHQQPLLTP